jgi:hypothetical protein
LPTLLVVNRSAHIRGGNIDPIVEQRGTMEEVAMEVTAVVERVASDHTDDIGPLVEETGLSMMALMEGKEEASQQKELFEAIWVCFQDKKKRSTHNTFRRRCTIAGHIGGNVLKYVM